MMPLVLYVLGGLMLLAAAVAALIGCAIVPQLVIGGLFLVVGLAIERWRYKPFEHRAPDPSWEDTGERFVDPQSGAVIAVYGEPGDGTRHYLVTNERSDSAP